MTDREEILARALGYPFVDAERDFQARLFQLQSLSNKEKNITSEGLVKESLKITASDPVKFDIPGRTGAYEMNAYSVNFKAGDKEYNFENRVALLAIGSNSSDVQLTRKFSQFGNDVDVTIVPAWLEDYAVVYTPFYAPYGSIAATLYHMPGISCRVTIGFYTKNEAALITTTEGPYDIRRINHKITFDNGVLFNNPAAYISTHGVLTLDQKRPVLLSEIPHKLTEERSQELSVCTQKQIQTLIQKELKVPGTIENHINDIVCDDKKRITHDAALQKDYSLLFGEGKETTILTEGLKNPDYEVLNYNPKPLHG